MHRSPALDQLPVLPCIPGVPKKVPVDPSCLIDVHHRCRSPAMSTTSSATSRQEHEGHLGDAGVPYEVPTLDLWGSGRKMPLVGLGMWLQNPEAENVIDTALEIGYRHFDTAYAYGTEAVLGRALNRWIDSEKVSRGDLFVVTKLPMVANRRSSVGPYLRKSLDNLKLDCVDLYLIHNPPGLKDLGNDDLHPKDPDSDKALLWDMDTDLVELWKGMEEQVDAGFTKAIGLSNFNSEQVGRILNNCRIRPTNNQIELHAYFQQPELVKYCQDNAVTVTAFSPLGSPGRIEAWRALGHGDPQTFVPPLMENSLVKNLANKYHATPAQILLRFLTQKHVAVIPKSANKERMKENIEIFKFTIDELDMKEMEKLDQGIAGRSFRFFDTTPGIEKHPEYPFFEQLVDQSRMFTDKTQTRT